MTIKLAVGKTYLNRRGEKVTIISNDSDVSYPFNSAYTRYTRYGKYFCGSNADDQDLVAEYVEPVQKPLLDINYLVEDLIAGKVFYTEEGNKVHMDKGKLMFDTKNLDLNKIVHVELYSRMWLADHPLVNKVCKVWDSNKDNCKYGVVTKVWSDRQYKYVLSTGSEWQNAELVIQSA